MNLRYEHFCLVSIHFLVKIRRNTSFEVFRLSYIYNSMVLVIVLVAARLLRHTQYDVL